MRGLMFCSRTQERSLREKVTIGRMFRSRRGSTKPAHTLTRISSQPFVRPMQLLPMMHVAKYLSSRSGSRGATRVRTWAASIAYPLWRVRRRSLVTLPSICSRTRCGTRGRASGKGYVIRPIGQSPLKERQILYRYFELLKTGVLPRGKIARLSLTTKSPTRLPLIEYITSVYVWVT